MSAPELTVTETFKAGIYDIDERLYHQDPVAGGSLSSSGAKKLLECPAKYHHDRTAGEQFKDTYNFGSAVHTSVLGAGREVIYLDYPDYRKAEARDAKEEVIAAGNYPLLIKDQAGVVAITNAVHAHPEARALLGQDGAAEQSVLWEMDGIRKRARPDFLPSKPSDNGRLLVVDFKTAVDSSPAAFSRSCANFGYAQQDAWYSEGIAKVTGLDVAFLFVVVEKEPPYVVSVYELDELAKRIGEHRNDIAIRRYIECTESGIWPGYVTGIEQLALPRWAEIEYQEQIEMQQEGYAA